MTVSPEFHAALADLIARAHATSDAMDRDNASGWAVLVTDDEPPVSHTAVVGLFETPEAALVYAGERHAEDVRMNPGEPHLWSYTVLPLFRP